ncbi:putative quinol monooxygenase [Poseidonocella sp. HB161398]|uniref:putative quinol monooxygenase n=1 Tax=Poseidonocella sp. HB161398 TaxID=2320855 RepID=UPI001109ED5C|nr:putative quinol monooxygenase [Poseidonocella sp. HB161398]
MIYLVAMHHARPGFEDRLRQSLQDLVEPTRAEAGCVQYDLHESSAEPGRFLFYEIWETRAHLEAHAASRHLAAQIEASRDWVAQTELLPLDRIG